VSRIERREGEAAPEILSLHRNLLRCRALFAAEQKVGRPFPTFLAYAPIGRRWIRRSHLQQMLVVAFYQAQRACQGKSGNVLLAWRERPGACGTQSVRWVNRLKRPPAARSSSRRRRPSSPPSAAGPSLRSIQSVGGW